MGVSKKALRKAEAPRKAVGLNVVRHRLDPEGDRISLYLRLTATLRSRIENGDWAKGERIPSIELLCKEYDLARNTVRQALQLLKSDGLIGGGRGIGTVVLRASHRNLAGRELKDAISDPLNLGADQSIKVLKRRRNATVPDGLRGSLPTYDDYTELRKIHRFRGRPFALLDKSTGVRAVIIHVGG